MTATNQAPAVAGRTPWWRGTRGQWYVVAQGALMLLVVLGPRDWPRIGLERFGYSAAWSVAGLLLIAAGLMLGVAGGFSLGGRNLTPLPAPRAHGTLVERGAYRLVRHPMYSGGVLFAFGWAIWARGPLTLVYALALLVFVDVKSRREERWLSAKFPGYAAYQARVRKLVPFVY